MVDRFPTVAQILRDLRDRPTIERHLPDIPGVFRLLFRSEKDALTIKRYARIRGGHELPRQNRERAIGLQENDPAAIDRFAHRHLFTCPRLLDEEDRILDSLRHSHQQSKNNEKEQAWRQENLTAAPHREDSRTVII